MRIPSAGHESDWPVTGELDTAYNALTVGLRLDMPLAQARCEPAAAPQRLLGVIAPASARGLEAGYGGEVAPTSMHRAQHVGWIRRWRAERSI